MKAVATQNLFVAQAGTSATLGNNTTGGLASTTSDLTPATGLYAYTVAVTDANGNAALATSPKAVSSNTAVIASSSCYLDSVTTGTYNCNVVSATGSISGQTATVTFEGQDSSGNYTVLSAPLTFAVGGTVASEVLSTDATSYNALAPIKLTVTAKDSAGNTPYDRSGTALVGSLLSTTQLGGTLSSPTVLINGVGSVTGIYAPAVAGDFTISGVDNIATAGEAVTPVTATSNGGSSDAAANAATDAANEATDAANAATDAANAAADSADAATAAAQDAGDKADAALAAVTALSQQVTTLLSKVAALAATIAKIAKKVKA